METRYKIIECLNEYCVWTQREKLKIMILGHAGTRVDRLVWSEMPEKVNFMS